MKKEYTAPEGKKYYKNGTVASGLYLGINDKISNWELLDEAEANAKAEVYNKEHYPEEEVPVVEE